MDNDKSLLIVLDYIKNSVISKSIEQLSNYLVTAERTSFFSSEVIDARKELKKSIELLEIVAEIIDGNELHTKDTEKYLMSSLTTFFGKSFINRSEIVSSFTTISNNSVTPVQFTGTLVSLQSVGLVTVNNKEAVQISWNSSSDFSTYNLYRNGELIATVLDNTLTSFTDTDISEASLYSYSIEGISEVFGKLPMSPAKTIKTSVTSIPEAPTLNTPTYLNNGISLSWNQVTDITSYAVYRDDTLIQTVQSLSFIDTSITKGISYTYTVKSVNTVGVESVASNSMEAELLVTVNTPIIRQAVIASATEVELKWSNGGSDTQVSFNVYVNDSLQDASVVGIRTQVLPNDPNYWLVDYTITIPDTSQEVSFYITSIYDGRESLRSDIMTINEVSPQEDIRLKLNNIDYTTLVNDGGLSWPINGEFEIESTFEGVGTVSGYRITTAPTGFTISESDTNLVQLNDGSIPATLNFDATSTPTSWPAALSGEVLYYSSLNPLTILDSSSYYFRLNSSTIAFDYYLTEELPTGNLTITISSDNNAIDYFQPGRLISISSEQLVINDSVLTSSGTEIDILLNSPYTGVTVPYGTEVSLVSANPTPVTVDSVYFGNIVIKAIGDTLGSDLSEGSIFRFFGSIDTHTVRSIIWNQSRQLWDITLTSTYTGATISAGTELIIL